ncbi:hypothetical protein PV04_07366 [Phialophora macrospora]|uniref:endo-1,3(4)-beta-glucanase n=1 Tax=Phialophora macrospora TaxID=1851006 RepID=A0A0D2DSE0_9EURO|nr:hypothetical protein PV04_07366 [Phialophora macrospora]
MWASSILVTLVGLLVSFSTAGYVLQDDYSPDQFFSMFDFFTDSDPTNGYVQYVDQSTAQQGGLINNDNGAIYMGVDHSNVASGSGRQSVRLTSKKSYTHGLIVLDLSHMPGGICGTWPAFWTVGPNWPNAGEIDIIEGVNSQRANSMALHTGQGCSVSNNGLFSGRVSTPNCDVNAAGQPGNAGCAILTPNDQSYGTGFNQGQGGVYATEWTSQAINIWFFPRGAIPSDLSSSSGNPDPSGWGQPMASFSDSGCNIDDFFNDHQIVFDTTFCGDWAGNAAVWASDAVCGSKAPTCQAFVQNNPSAFQDAYWTVNSLKVYQSSGAEGPPATVTASVPFPGPPSGVPPVSPVTSPFSYGGGGGGRHTRSFGDWGANFVAEPSAALSPSASLSMTFDARTPTATVGPPLVLVSTAPSDANAVTLVASGSGTGTGTDKYMTVVALGEDDFRPGPSYAQSHAHPRRHPLPNPHPQPSRSERDATMEPRSPAPEEGADLRGAAVAEAFRAQLLSRHRRHLFKHVFPEARSDD